MRSVAEPDLRKLIGALAETTWAWTVDQIPTVTHELGWNFIEIIEGKAAFATADWSLGEDDIQFALNDSQVNNVTVPLTDNPPRTTGGHKFLLDTFAWVASATTAIIGAPTQRTSGNQPSARWRLPDTTIILSHARVAVALTWANNTFQDHWDALREAQ